MRPRSSILTLLLTAALTAAPLRAMVHAGHAEEGSSHVHGHFHDGFYHTHTHHHHEGDRQEEPSDEPDHHGSLGDVADGPRATPAAPCRRLSVTASAPAPAPGALVEPPCTALRPIRRGKPPPWTAHLRSSQATQLRTIILLV